MKPLQPRSVTSSRAQAQALHALALGALAAALVACGGDGGEGPSSTPGPSNTIVFGGQELDTERWGLWLIEPDGAGLRPLVAEDGMAGFASWSPEGGPIAYLVADADATVAALRVYDFDSEIATTVSERAVWGDGPPSWSPDGRRFVFVEESDGETLLRIYDLGRDELLDLPDVPGSEPAWSPTTDEIAYVRAPTQLETDLYIVDADLEGRRPLLQGEGIESGPRWSPDGGHIAFSSRPPADADSTPENLLFVADVETGELTSFGPGFGAAWSPDGTRLAYSRPKEDAPATSADLYVVGVAGGEPEPLSESSTVDAFPSWSMDGNSIVYLAQADVRTSFACLVQLDPEQRDCLELPGLRPAAPTWSPH